MTMTVVRPAGCLRPVPIDCVVDDPDHIRTMAELNGSYGAYPGTDNAGAGMFVELAEAAGFDGTGAFSPESYDAAALIMLAMQAANSADGAGYPGLSRGGEL